MFQLKTRLDQTETISKIIEPIILITYINQLASVNHCNITKE